MSERKCKTVSFDLSEEFERELLEHAESKGKFSRYVKRLIDEDRKGLAKGPVGNVSGHNTYIVDTHSEDKLDDYTMEAMSGYL